MSTSTLFTIMGVAILGVVLANQSGESTPNDPPMAIRDRGGQNDVPEVVLQLKYDKGELNRIYLTQFRKDAKVWAPSVSARKDLCADLCHAGLGGEACGATCPQLIPVGLQTALQDHNMTGLEAYGQPRYSVCPALCSNYLGEPLCNCATKDVDHAPNWNAVCTAFCYEGYTLNGCPTCDASTMTDAATFSSLARVLDTSDGWAAWCNVQCRQGQGGAACNCSRTPFQR